LHMMPTSWAIGQFQVIDDSNSSSDHFRIIESRIVFLTEFKVV